MFLTSVSHLINHQYSIGYNLSNLITNEVYSYQVSECRVLSLENGFEKDKQSSI